MKQKCILVINAGSATLKFKVFTAGNLKLAKEGIVERIGLNQPFIAVNGKKKMAKAQNHEQAFGLVLEGIGEYKDDLVGVGHRVVHGGEEFVKPIKINRDNLKRLEKYNKLAPLHNPVSIACIKASQKYLPKVKDTAVFDTMFFQTLPNYAYLYALPLKYYKQNKIRRYGFHGISHNYLTLESARKLKKDVKNLNLITCHLGSGCSISAIKNGKAIDTSMGFTPLEGLVMSTRSGSIDPAIALYLIRDLKMSASQVDDLLNKKSGLLGLSGSADMREILVKAGYKVPGFVYKGKISAEIKANAGLTLRVFIYNIKKYLGAYSAVLGRVDAVSFSGGIGERSPLIRRLILKNLPKVKSLVVPANEELMIARLIKNLI